MLGPAVGRWGASSVLIAAMTLAVPAFAVPTYVAPTVVDPLAETVRSLDEGLEGAAALDPYIDGTAPLYAFDDEVLQLEGGYGEGEASARDDFLRRHFQWLRSYLGDAVVTRWGQGLGRGGIGPSSAAFQFAPVSGFAQLGAGPRLSKAPGKSNGLGPRAQTGTVQAGGLGLGLGISELLGTYANALPWQIVLYAIDDGAQSEEPWFADESEGEILRRMVNARELFEIINFSTNRSAAGRLSGPFASAKDLTGKIQDDALMAEDASLDALQWRARSGPGVRTAKLEPEQTLPADDAAPRWQPRRSLSQIAWALLISVLVSPVTYVALAVAGFVWWLWPSEKYG